MFSAWVPSPGFIQASCGGRCAKLVKVRMDCQASHGAFSPSSTIKINAFVFLLGVKKPTEGRLLGGRARISGRFPCGFISVGR